MLSSKNFPAKKGYSWESLKEHFIEQNEVKGDQDSEKEECYTLFVVDSNKKLPAIVAEVTIEGEAIKMEVDTGASVSIISETIYSSKFSDKPLSKTSIKLRSYVNTLLPVLGMFTAAVEYQTQKVVLPVIHYGSATWIWGHKDYKNINAVLLSISVLPGGNVQVFLRAGVDLPTSRRPPC